MADDSDSQPPASHASVRFPYKRLCCTNGCSPTFDDSFTSFKVSFTLLLLQVATDLFILDMNTTVVTPLQAFCIALTNFDCKLLL